MYCKNCGAQIDDRAVVCPHCGVPTDNYAAKPQGVASDDAPSGGFLALCLFFPLLGLILYLVWKDQYPQRAKSCGKGAIIGVCLEVGLSILLIILVFVIAGIAASAPYYYSLFL